MSGSGIPFCFNPCEKNVATILQIVSIRRLPKKQAGIPLLESGLFFPSSLGRGPWLDCGQPSRDGGAC